MSASRTLGKLSRTPLANCLNCGRKMDGATMINGDERPSSGDITICIWCAHIMAFDDDLRFRELTDDERSEVAGDRTVVEAVNVIGQVNRDMT